MPFPFDFEAEEANRLKRKEFHKSRGMVNKARELLVLHTPGVKAANTSDCKCLVCPEFCTEDGFVYRAVSAHSNCSMHFGTMDIRFFTLKPSAEDPQSIAKMIFVGITDRSALSAAGMVDRPEPEPQRLAITRYKDIEKKFESEERANPERFRPHVHVPQDEEVTPENWMKFI